MGKRINSLLETTMGWLPARMALAMMSWFGFINLYMVRINLSVIIVAMVRRNSSSTFSAPCLPPLNTSFYNDSQRHSDNSSLPEGDMEGEMEWSETVQGFVLGSFYYGYAASQILGGRLAEMYGTRWVFGGCILSGGISALLTPTAARLHYGVLIALRAAQGFCQGVSWPSMHPLISRWFPPLERSRVVGFVYFATALSTSMTLPLCGLIIDAYGWPVAFYVTGSCSLLWCVVWFAFMYETPADHPRIGDSELAYVTTELEKSGIAFETSKRSAPWREILTSLPVWAIIVCGVGNNYNIALFQNHLPTYMKNILGFSITQNGFLSALPFLSRYLGSIVWSSLADWLSSSGRLSVLSARRIASFIALIGPGVTLVVVAYTGCMWKTTVALFCLALFTNGAVAASYLVNHTDISPIFAGTIFGIDNTVGSIISFIVPAVVGVMTDGQQTLSQWRKVFWSCLPLCVFSEVFFVMFSSASVQPWNTVELERDAGTLAEVPQKYSYSQEIEPIDE